MIGVVYEFFEHTADIGIRVLAPDLGSLLGYVNADHGTIWSPEASLEIPCDRPANADLVYENESWLMVIDMT
jgi:hypothetical protein